MRNLQREGLVFAVATAEQIEEVIGDQTVLGPGLSSQPGAARCQG